MAPQGWGRSYILVFLLPIGARTASRTPSPTGCALTAMEIQHLLGRVEGRQRAKSSMDLQLHGRRSSRLVNVRNIIVHRKYILDIFFVRKHVDHPRKHHRKKLSTFGIARFLGVDRTEHAELRRLAVILLDLAFRRTAKVRVLMP